MPDEPVFDGIFAASHVREAVGGRLRAPHVGEQRGRRARDLRLEIGERSALIADVAGAERPQVTPVSRQVHSRLCEESGDRSES
jgi:hypothetical protein